MSRRESLQNSAFKNISAQCIQSKLSKKKFIHFLITIIENVECQFLPKLIICHQLLPLNKISIRFWFQKITWQGIKKIIIILIKKWCYGEHKTDKPFAPKLTRNWPDFDPTLRVFQKCTNVRQNLVETRAENKLRFEFRSELSRNFDERW